MAESHPSNLRACPHCGLTKPLEILPHAWLLHDEDCECSEISEGHADSYVVCCNYQRGGCGACGGCESTKAAAAEKWNRRPAHETGASRADELFGALNDFLNQWKNRGEETSLHEWHMRMKASAARAEAVLSAPGPHVEPTSPRPIHEHTYKDGYCTACGAEFLL